MFNAFFIDSAFKAFDQAGERRENSRRARRQEVLQSIELLGDEANEESINGIVGGIFSAGEAERSGFGQKAVASLAERNRRRRELSELQSRTAVVQAEETINRFAENTLPTVASRGRGAFDAYIADVRKNPALASAPMVASLLSAYDKDPDAVHRDSYGRWFESTVTPKLNAMMATPAGAKALTTVEGMRSTLARMGVRDPDAVPMSMLAPIQTQATEVVRAQGLRDQQTGMDIQRLDLTIQQLQQQLAEGAAVVAGRDADPITHLVRTDEKARADIAGMTPQQLVDYAKTIPTTRPGGVQINLDDAADRIRAANTLAQSRLAQAQAAKAADPEAVTTMAGKIKDNLWGILKEGVDQSPEAWKNPATVVATEFGRTDPRTDAIMAIAGAYSQVDETGRSVMPDVLSALRGAKGKTGPEVMAEVLAKVPNLKTRGQLENEVTARANLEAATRLAPRAVTFAAVGDFVETDMQKHIASLDKGLQTVRGAALTSDQQRFLAISIAEAEQGLLPRLRALKEQTSRPGTGFDLYDRRVSATLRLAETYVREGRERLVREAPPPPLPPQAAAAPPPAPPESAYVTQQELTPEQREERRLIEVSEAEARAANSAQRMDNWMEQLRIAETRPAVASSPAAREQALRQRADIISRQSGTITVESLLSEYRRRLAAPQPIAPRAAGESGARVARETFGRGQPMTEAEAEEELDRIYYGTRRADQR